MTDNERLIQALNDSKTEYRNKAKALQACYQDNDVLRNRIIELEARLRDLPLYYQGEKPVAYCPMCQRYKKAII